MSAVNIRIAADVTQARKEIAVLQQRVKRLQREGGKDLKKFGVQGDQALTGLVQSAGLARVGMAGVGYAVGRLTKQSFTEFARLQKGWAEVTTLMPQATKKMTDQMNVEMGRLAKDTGKHLGDVYRAAYEAVSAGVPADATTDFLRIATDAALGGVTDMTTAVDGLTTVLNTYNLSMEDTSLVSDQFFTAVRLGKTTLPLLAYNVAQVTPLAQAMGIGFDQVAAGLAALTAQGRPTAQAATQIRAVLDQLSDAETKVGKLFTKHTGTTFPNFLKAGGALREAMVIVVNAAKDADKQVAEVFGRVEGALGAIGLASEASARIHEEYMRDIVGATEVAAEKMKETWQFQIDQAKAQWLGMKNWFAEHAIAPVITVGVEVVTGSGDRSDAPGRPTRRGGRPGQHRPVYPTNIGGYGDAASGGQWRLPTGELGDEFTARDAIYDAVERQFGASRTGPRSVATTPASSDWSDVAASFGGEFGGNMLDAAASSFRGEFEGLVGTDRMWGFNASTAAANYARTAGLVGFDESAGAVTEAERTEIREQRERDEKARMEAVWGTEWASWARGDTGDFAYFRQLEAKRDYLGGLQTPEGIQVQQELNRLVKATETKADDNEFYVYLRSDDKPDRVERAERGPIQTRPRGACG